MTTKNDNVPKVPNVKKETPSVAKPKVDEVKNPPADTKTSPDTAPVKPLQEKEKKPSDSSRFHKRAKEVFANHKVDEVHFTEDGTAFIEPQHARIHAESLEEKKVVTIKKEEV